MDWLQRLTTYLYENLIAHDRYWILLRGLGMTLYLTVVSYGLGVVIGAILCVFRLSSNKAVAKISAGFTYAIKKLPIFLLIIVFIQIVFAGLQFNLVTVVIFGIALKTGTYISEINCAAVRVVDPVQIEAGWSLGMSRFTALRLVAIPQAIRFALPFYKNQLVSTLQFSPLASYFAIMELTLASRELRNQTHDPFISSVIIVVVYLGLGLVIEGLASWAFRPRHLYSGDYFKQL